MPVVLVTQEDFLSLGAVVCLADAARPQHKRKQTITNNITNSMVILTVGKSVDGC